MTRNLSHELVRRGHDVHIFRNANIYNLVKGRRITPAREDGEDTPYVTIHESIATNSAIDAALNHTFGFDGRSVSQLKRIVADVKPDVIHWHNTKAFIGAPCPFDSTVNLLTAHDYYTICPKSSLLKPDGAICLEPSLCQFCQVRSGKVPQLWRIGTRRILSMPPDLRVISPSSYMADRLRNDGLRVAETIPNFVDDPGPVGHDVTSGVVVFIGILEPHKGPHILIDAFASTMQRHNLSLHVVGDGSMRSLLNDKVERLGASERIILTGRLPDDELRRRLSGAVALIVPSIWLENCPLVALEALSFGVPILASAIGGLNEIAASVDSSATFLPGNREDLGRKLLEVWHNWRGDTKLRRNARNAYTENYSPDRHIKRYMEVISKSTN